MKNEIIGSLGAFFLAICGLFEVIHAFKHGGTGISSGLLYSWYIGEILCMIYVLGKNKEVKLLPLLYNYGLNIVFISILILFKLDILGKH